MSITVSFTFDDTWAARIQAMVESPQAARRIELSDVAQALLESLSLEYDDLTSKQKWKLNVLLDTLEHLQQYEGNEAAQTARQVVLDDIEQNFPLEVGDA